MSLFQKKKSRKNVSTYLKKRTKKNKKILKKKLKAGSDNPQTIENLDAFDFEETLSTFAPLDQSANSNSNEPNIQESSNPQNERETIRYLLSELENDQNRFDDMTGTITNPGHDGVSGAVQNEISPIRRPRPRRVMEQTTTPVLTRSVRRRLTDSPANNTRSRDNLSGGKKKLTKKSKK